MKHTFKFYIGSYCGRQLTFKCLFEGLLGSSDHMVTVHPSAIYGTATTDTGSASSAGIYFIIWDSMVISDPEFALVA